MVFRLEDLKVAEVSIVPRGANKQQFLITKEGDGMPTALEEVLKKEGIIVGEAPKETDEILKGVSEKALNAVKAALKILAGVKDELPGDALKALASVAGYGYPAPAAKDKTPPYGYPMPMKKEDGSWDFSQIPSESRATVEALWKERLASEEKIALLEKSVKEEKDARLVKEFTDKATEFKSLCANANDLGKVMKSLSEKDADAFKTFEGILKAANEQIKKSALFSEAGSNTGGNSADSPNAKVEALAKEYMAKDANLTQAKAIAKAWLEHPELYTQATARTN